MKPTQPELPLPPAPAAADKTWFKAELVNHGAATVALKRPGAWAKWLLRRKGLVELTTVEVKPDVLGGIECGSGAAWDYISKKYAQAGLHRVPGGKEGRHLWISRAAKVIDSGSFDPPARNGDKRPAPWAILDIDGTTAFVILSHLEFRDPTSEWPLKQQKAIVAYAEKMAARAGIGKSRIFFLGDLASDNYVRRQALEAAGYKSVFDVARRSINKAIASYNRGRAPVNGPSVDVIAVYSAGSGKGDYAPRPVRVANKRLTNKSDHHVLAAVIERQ